MAPWAFHNIMLGRGSTAVSACELVQPCKAALFDLGISNEGVEYVEQFLTLFPLFSGIIFELHHDADSLNKRLDIGLRINKADLSAFVQTSETWLKIPELIGLIQLLKDWKIANTHTLYGGIEHLWIEYDANAEGGYHQIPAVFFDLIPISQEEKLTIVNQTLSIFNQNLTPATIDLLASNNSLRWVGLMLSRTGNPLRLCFKLPQGDHPIEVLSVWNIQPKNQLFNDLVNFSHQVGANFVIHLDGKEPSTQSIGIEVKFTTEVQMEVFLPLLVEQGLLTARDFEGLLTWPRVHDVEQSNWAAYLKENLGRNIKFLAQRINHFKLTLSTKNKISLKSYLYIGYF